MRKAVFAALTFVLVLGAAEAALRVAKYQGEPAVMDFRLRVQGELFGEPDSVRFWRLPGVEPHFTGDAARIVCLADSVTVMEQGRGWPDRLPGNLIERGYAKPVQVFNAGVPAYSTHQGVLYLDRELMQWDPHLVTIQFVWNDHWESLTGVPDKHIQLPGPRLLELQKTLAHVRLYRLLRSAMVDMPQPTGEPRVTLDDFSENLRRMVRRVRAQQGRVILLTAPYLDGPWDWLPRHLEYNDAVRLVAAEMDVTLVDTAADFLTRRDLFFWPDTDACHFNADGAVVVAQAVADAIIANGLLP